MKVLLRLRVLGMLMVWVVSWARAETWSWDPSVTGGASPGGPGTWDATGLKWWDGTANQSWGDNVLTDAALSGGVVTVNGMRRGGRVSLAAGTTLTIPQATLTHRLTLNDGLLGEGVVRFTGKWTVDRYDASLMNTGLRFAGGASQSVETDFAVADLNVSPVVTVEGNGTSAVFRAAWDGDGGNCFPHVFLRNGGRFVLHEDAELDFVNDAYFTRQFWISGGGETEADGVFEFASGFVADRSNGGTTADGLGSIRLNHAVVVTRHSQSIPVGFRPRPGHPEGPQTNGHFVFEHNPGMWIIRENAQTYPGALWFRTDAEIRTETDLTHTGVTEDDSVSPYPYRAGNAFQTQEENITLRKTGEAKLILSGEQAYRPGTDFQVEKGSVRFLTDPAAGSFHNSISQPPDPAGPDLELTVLKDGTAEFVAPSSEMAALNATGTLVFELGADDGTKLRVHGNASVTGPLQLRYVPGNKPSAGDSFTLIHADTLTFTPTEISAAPGVHVSVEADGGKVTVTVLPPPGTSGSSTLIEEEFLSLADWDDLSTAVTWTSIPAASTVFQISADGGSSDVLNLNDASRDVGMWGSDSIRSYSAIDQRFDTPVSHRDHEVTVEFRIRWDLLDSNEGNRVIFTLIHDYPQGGLDLTPDAKVTDRSQDWWGRPAYQVRLRSKISSDGVPIFLYGGGHDVEGEFEQSGDGEWLAGFSSAANGTSPGDGSPYPDNSWKFGDFSPVSTSYRRFRYIVKPTIQELWVDDDDDGDGWAKVGDMPLPFEEDAPVTAPLYRYFEQFEGLRIYFRSPGTGANASNVYLDYVNVTVEPVPEFASFADWAVSADLPAGQEGPGDDPYSHGVTNYERYAHGYAADTEPPEPVQPALLASTSLAAFHFQRPRGGRPDVTYTLWTSTDLTNPVWTPLDPATDWSVVSTGGETETVRVEVPVPEAGPVFVGLEMESP